MKNELIGYMYNGTVGEGDCATITQLDRPVKVDCRRGIERIFESAHDAIRFLKNEGYASFFGVLEEIYLN